MVSSTPLAHAPRQAKGYSLWMAPSPAVREKLQALIQQLANRVGTTVFPAHLTLVGGLRGPVSPLLAAAQDLAEQISPLTVSVAGTAWTTEFFRTFYLKAHLDTSLQDAYGTAQQRFDSSETRPFEPHVSLVYGHVESGIKHALADQLRGHYPESIEITHLELYETEGDIEDWRLLKRIPLRGR